MTDEQQITETDVDETKGYDRDISSQNSEGIAEGGTHETSTPEDDLNTADAALSDNDGKKGNSEAAKWRVKLRETETERDALKARVGDMQAAEVSRLATGPGALHDGGDLLLTTQLENLLDDEGNVDPEKVSEAVATLTERKPHLARPAFDGAVGIGEKGTPSGASWADVIGS